MFCACMQRSPFIFLFNHYHIYAHRLQIALKSQ